MKNMHKSAIYSKSMRTTLDLDDLLITQAKTLAASEHKSLTQVIEEGLALRLSKATTISGRKPKGIFPIYQGQGGLQAGARRAKGYRELLDAIDEPGAL